MRGAMATETGVVGVVGGGRADAEGDGDGNGGCRRGARVDAEGDGGGNEKSALPGGEPGARLGRNMPFSSDEVTR